MFSTASLKWMAGSISVLVLLSFSVSSKASGFRIHLENSSDLGNAYAGGAALTDDATISAFNPAGLSFLHKQQFIVSLAGVASHSRFEGTVTAPNLDMESPSFTALTRNESNNSGFIPAIYYNYPLNAQWDIGLSVNEPFGLGLDYGENSNLRYSIIKASQLGIDIGPSLSYLINPQWSIGIGPNFEHYSVNSATKLNTVFPDMNMSDSRTDIDASGWGYGGHIGLLYAPTEDTHIGLSYRTKIHNNLYGKSHFELGMSPPFMTTSDSSKLIFSVPAISMLSVTHALTKKWTFLATIDYTEWSVFNKVNSYNIAQLDVEAPINISIPEKFHNTVHLAVAANYHANEQWLFRLGAGYDEDPVRTTYRSALFPNGQTVAIAIGARYLPTKNSSVDIGYLHSFIRQVNVNNTYPITSANLNGKLQTDADILGVQLVWTI